MKNNSNFEDYLKNIYSIKISKGKVTTSELAERMGISSASVSEMISKLSKSGYVKYLPYKDFELTKKGDEIAINLIRKHRIWEVFLVEYLKYPWDKVHTEAEILEHTSSNELIERLEEFLHFPKTDPHGYPIPDRNGHIEKDKSVRLTELKPGDRALIIKVSDESSEVLGYLTKMNINLKDEIKILEKINFDNSIQIQNKKEKIFLSEKLSANIFVIKL
ncbi:MAG TPA: metal-dependent transcriptional regulator [Ignavibacteria bacterium]|nr:metal-dependent transcriptional regulator [Ignavibacteria bacterium]